MGLDWIIAVLITFTLLLPTTKEREPTWRKLNASLKTSHIYIKRGSLKPRVSRFSNYLYSRIKKIIIWFYQQIFCRTQ